MEARIPPLNPDDLSERQQELFDSIAGPQLMALS